MKLVWMLDKVLVNKSRAPHWRGEGSQAGGRPHEAVMRRLRRAAKLYAASRERGHTLAVVANGGGTTHKPRWVSPAGYAVPEAALMARELEAEGGLKKGLCCVYIHTYTSLSDGPVVGGAGPPGLEN